MTCCMSITTRPPTSTSSVPTRRRASRRSNDATTTSRCSRGSPFAASLNTFVTAPSPSWAPSISARASSSDSVSEDHDAQTFVDFLPNVLDECYPTGRGHILCDNLSMHDTDDVLDWFDEHPRWTRHFTPKHASWLNQIECIFGILEKRVVPRGSFTSKENLRDKLYAYMLWHNTPTSRSAADRPKSWSANSGTISDWWHAKRYS